LNFAERNRWSGFAYFPLKGIQIEFNSIIPKMGVLLDYVVPIIGTVLTNFLFFSPMQTVLQIDESGQLGDLNPLPYPLMVFNCAGWIIYGLSFGNPTVYYMFAANFSGVINGIYYSLVTFPLASRAVQINMRRLFVILPLISLSAAYFLAFGLRNDSETLHTALGVIAISISVVFFASPLSTIVDVLRSKSARTIHIPLSITAGTSTFLWTIYGIAISDWFIIIPNALATIFSSIQLILVMVFRKRDAELGTEKSVVEAIPKELSKSQQLPDVEIQEVA
jgi:solute carrier family 50 protein (sugar transporter)